MQYNEQRTVKTVGLHLKCGIVKNPVLKLTSSHLSISSTDTCLNGSNHELLELYEENEVEYIDGV